MPGKKGSGKGAYRHRNASRTNLPTSEMADEMKTKDAAAKYYRLQRRPGDDPQLAWDRRWDPGAEIPHRPLFIQEKLHPDALIKSLCREVADNEPTLPADFNGLTDEQYTQWYQHRARWQNRLIHGNALEICASLADREGLAGKVQVIYFDPPYGIRFQSNFAMEAGKGGTDDSAKSVGAEPQSVKAFIDTWEHGVHSYMDAIHKHLQMARSLLADTGSIFVQIGDENMMRVGMVLDEVFGAKNRIATISFAKTGMSSAEKLSSIADYLLWYAKDENQAKYHQLYEPLDRAGKIELMSFNAMVEEQGKPKRKLTEEERTAPDTIPDEAQVFRGMPLDSEGVSKTGRSEPYTHQGKEYPCPPNRQWSVSAEGMDRLAEKNRLVATKGSLNWKRYEDEIPGRKISNLWAQQMSPSDKRYAVQTANLVVERCILMASDPGDLVLDFTCGSGTTPFVAEKWGRRWIAVDASQIALATARTRMATATFDYWAVSETATGQEAERLLRKNPELKSVGKSSGDELTQDPAQGFVYRRVPRISAKVLAYDLEDETEPVYLVNQPVNVRGVTRFCSPFTVESDRPYRHISLDEAVATESRVQDAQADYYASHERTRAEVMMRTGIRRMDGSHLEVGDLTDCLTKPLTHVATYRDSADYKAPSKRMAIAFAPDDATVSVGFMRAAGRVAREQLGQSVDLVVVCGFAFDPETSEVKQHLTLPIARVQMNRQFQIEEVKIEKADDNAFVMLGEPDVELLKDGDQYRVEVKGFATFDPATGNAKFGSAEHIYCWMLDTDYDDRSFFARRLHFPGQHNDRQIKKLKKELASCLSQEAYEAMLSNRSMPFPKPKSGRIAVKIITRTGDEMIRTMTVE